MACERKRMVASTSLRLLNPKGILAQSPRLPRKPSRLPWMAGQPSVSTATRLWPISINSFDHGFYGLHRWRKDFWPAFIRVIRGLISGSACIGKSKRQDTHPAYMQGPVDKHRLGLTANRVWSRGSARSWLGTEMSRWWRGNCSTRCGWPGAA